MFIIKLLYALQIQYFNSKNLNHIFLIFFFFFLQSHFPLCNEFIQYNFFNTFYFLISLESQFLHMNSRKIHMKLFNFHLHLGSLLQIIEIKIDDNFMHIATICVNCQPNIFLFLFRFQNGGYLIVIVSNEKFHFFVI